MPTQRLSRPGCLDRITHEAVDVVVLDPTLQTNSTQHTKVSGGSLGVRGIQFGYEVSANAEGFQLSPTQKKKGGMHEEKLEMKHWEGNLVGRRERKQDEEEYMVQQRGMVLSCVRALADWRG